MIKQPEADFIIHAGEWATLWSFEPVTEAAVDFMAEYLELEDWQCFGNRFGADHREARQIANAMVHHGLKVLHPEYGYFQAK